MRRLVLFLSPVLVTLATACGVSLPGQPAPTPTPYRPAVLLTPRPTQPPAEPTSLVGTPGVPRPTATSIPAAKLGGSPVKVSEPLQGVLLDDRFVSPIIGETFTYRIYLPPDYQRSQTRRYPVLYMLHGTGGDYTEWTDSYLPEQVDRMLAAGQIPQIIIVMPNDGGQTYWANWSDGGPRWADYVTEDVVSTIDQRYRTLARSTSRAIGGLSMGGLGALNLAFKHPQVFGVVGGHSPSVRLEPDPALWFLQDDVFWEHNPAWLARHRSGLDSLNIWLDAGADDVWLPNVEAVHEALLEQGVHHAWHVFPGQHEAEYWIEHIPDYMRYYGAALRT